MGTVTPSILCSGMRQRSGLRPSASTWTSPVVALEPIAGDFSALVHILMSRFRVVTSSEEGDIMWDIVEVSMCAVTKEQEQKLHWLLVIEFFEMVHL